MDAELATTKEAQTDYPIHKLIKKRWSPRAFSDKPVDKDLIRQLFDAARWAPSSYNEQPWRFIIATKQDPDTYNELAQVLNEYNAEWATGAPVLGLTIAKEQFSRNGNPNKHAAHDVGQAMAYLTFEATKHNIFIHQMAGILPDKARDIYTIPQGYSPVTMFALGYLGDPDSLAEKFQKGEQAPRSRKSIDDIMFEGEFNT